MHVQTCANIHALARKHVHAHAHTRVCAGTRPPPLLTPLPAPSRLPSNPRLPPHTPPLAPLTAPPPPPIAPPPPPTVPPAQHTAHPRLPTPHRAQHTGRQKSHGDALEGAPGPALSGSVAAAAAGQCHKTGTRERCLNIHAGPMPALAACTGCGRSTQPYARCVSALLVMCTQAVLRTFRRGARLARAVQTHRQTHRLSWCKVPCSRPSEARHASAANTNVPHTRTIPLSCTHTHTHTRAHICNTNAHKHTSARARTRHRPPVPCSPPHAPGQPLPTGGGPPHQPSPASEYSPPHIGSEPSPGGCLLVLGAGCSFQELAVSRMSVRRMVVSRLFDSPGGCLLIPGAGCEADVGWQQGVAAAC